jgi:hypothetical protein
MTAFCKQSGLYTSEPSNPNQAVKDQSNLNLPLTCGEPYLSPAAILSGWCRSPPGPLTVHDRRDETGEPRSIGTGRQIALLDCALKASPHPSDIGCASGCKLITNAGGAFSKAPCTIRHPPGFCGLVSNAAASSSRASTDLARRGFLKRLLSVARAGPAARRRSKLCVRRLQVSAASVIGAALFEVTNLVSGGC